MRYRFRQIESLYSLIRCLTWACGLRQWWFDLVENTDNRADTNLYPPTFRLSVKLGKISVHTYSINHYQTSPILVIFTIKPLSHQIAMSQRLYSNLKTCQRAVGRREIRLKSSNLPARIQRSHGDHSVFF